MTHNTIDYAQIIRQHGHRLTPQRELILDAVCEGHGHSLFEDVCARVQGKSSAIDQSTVYRTLDLFCELGLVTVSHIEGWGKVYEIAAGQPDHHHLICRACGTEIEIGAHDFAAPFNAIQERYGFKVDTNHLILYGTCTNCSSQTSEESE